MNSTRTYQIGNHVLVVVQHYIDVTTQLPRLDATWTLTDAAGHHHAYDPNPGNHYPTLIQCTGKSWWCDDCEDQHAESWFTCSQCGERINPGTVVDSSTQYEQGRIAASIDGEDATEADVLALLATTDGQFGRQVDSSDAPTMPICVEVRYRFEGVTIKITAIPADVVTGGTDRSQAWADALFRYARHARADAVELADERPGPAHNIPYHAAALDLLTEALQDAWQRHGGTEPLQWSNRRARLTWPTPDTADTPASAG